MKTPLGYPTTWDGKILKPRCCNCRHFAYFDHGWGWCSNPANAYPGPDGNMPQHYDCDRCDRWTAHPGVRLHHTPRVVKTSPRPASEQDGGIVERGKGPEIKSGDPTK
jgi:hypothetical protein